MTRAFPLRCFAFWCGRQTELGTEVPVVMCTFATAVWRNGEYWTCFQLQEMSVRNVACRRVLGHVHEPERLITVEADLISQQSAGSTPQNLNITSVKIPFLEEEVPKRNNKWSQMSVTRHQSLHWSMSVMRPKQMSEFRVPRTLSLQPCEEKEGFTGPWICLFCHSLENRRWHHKVVKSFSLSKHPGYF